MASSYNLFQVGTAFDLALDNVQCDDSGSETEALRIPFQIVKYKLDDIRTKSTSVVFFCGPFGGLLYKPA